MGTTRAGIQRRLCSRIARFDLELAQLSHVAHVNLPVLCPNFKPGARFFATSRRWGPLSVDTAVRSNPDHRDSAESDAISRALTTESSVPFENVEPSPRPLGLLLRSWRLEPKPRRPAKLDPPHFNPPWAELTAQPFLAHSLQVVYGPDCIDQVTLPLSPERLLTIGRDQNAPNLRIEDTTISRRHATIHWDRDIQSFKILDEGSHNGVYVNGMRVTAAPLQPDDVIRIGQSLLLFRATRAAAKSEANCTSAESETSLLALLGALACSPQQQLTADAAEALLIGRFHSNSACAERVLRGFDVQNSPRVSMDLAALSRVEPQLVSDLSHARERQFPPKNATRPRGFRRWLSWLAPK